MIKDKRILKHLNLNFDEENKLFITIYNVSKSFR